MSKVCIVGTGTEKLNTVYANVLRIVNLRIVNFKRNLIRFLFKIY